ncbi:MAG: hypothetical protein H0V86_11545 [Chloroflexia bacterium]|nr:hypothetical protein [Chloroflexia bacterium]MDQ3327035.1 hypothetical protein [Chloroflexota bacterium]
MVTAGDPLARRRYVSVVVRLLLESNGVLVSGEVVRVPDTQAMLFRRWEELVPQIQQAVELERDFGEKHP